jgi:hypothetical protein
MDPLLYIEKGLSYDYRRKWGKLLFLWSIFFLSLSMVAITSNFPEIYVMFFEFLFLLFLVTYFVNALSKAFFLHLYKERLKKMHGMSFEVLVAHDKGRIYGDDVIGFINSHFGDQVMKRLGISSTSIDEYKKKRNFKRRINLDQGRNTWLSLPEYVLALHDHDEHFAAYLRSQNVRRDDILYAANLVQNLSALEKQQDRVWSREVLHDFSPFEYKTIQLEKYHRTHIHSKVIRAVKDLNEEEKFTILKNIIKKAKEENKNEIGISDIVTWHGNNLKIA